MTPSQPLTTTQAAKILGCISQSVPGIVLRYRTITGLSVKQERLGKGYIWNKEDIERVAEWRGSESDKPVNHETRHRPSVKRPYAIKVPNVTNGPNRTMPRRCIPEYPEVEDMTTSMRGIYQYWLNRGLEDKPARRLAGLAFTDNPKYQKEREGRNDNHKRSN